MDAAEFSSVLLPTLLVAALALAAASTLQRAERRDRSRRHGARQDSAPAPPPRAEREPAPAPSEVSIPQTEGFLVNISHELRTPLVALLGYVELLGETRLGRHQRDYADAIAAAGGNLLDIVEDLSNLSRIESGQLTIHDQSFSVGDCVDGVAQMLALSAYQKGLDFIRIVDADVPARVRGDPLRLRQVLVNLLTNAIKFTRRGLVQIGVTVTAADAERIELEFAITDTGIGISAEDQRGLFQPFYRVDRVHDTQGTGLGLVITKRLCEAMHGTVTVTSQPDQGSRFVVRLPFHADPERSAAAALALDLTGHRILVYCANEALGAWLSDCLTRHGAHCERMATQAQLATASLDRYQLALVHIGQGLLSDQVQLSSFGATLYEKINVLSLVSTGSDSSLRQVERVMGGEAWPAHAPAATLCTRVAELAGSAAPRPVGHAGAQTVAALESLRLLVAEDNAVSRDYLHTMLSRHGASVDVCADGNMALELVQRNDYDAVLMDVRMPGGDGITAVRRLRSTGKSLPVIGLTAAAAECVKAREAGMTDCLVKPLSADELLKAIGAACSARPNPSFSGRDFIDEEMLAGLNAELPQHLQRITSALASDDHTSLFEEAHRLHGVASLFGLEPLRRRASELESCLRDGPASDIDPLAASVLREVTAVCEQLGRRNPD